MGKKIRQRYDAAYAEGKFKDLYCKHKNSVPYDSRNHKPRKDGTILIAKMKEVCTHCGRISRWAKCTGHTIGGGFGYTVKF